MKHHHPLPTKKDLEDMKRLAHDAKARGDERLYELLRQGYAACAVQMAVFA